MFVPFSRNLEPGLGSRSEVGSVGLECVADVLGHGEHVLFGCREAVLVAVVTCRVVGERSYGEANTHLSKVGEDVLAGEEVTVTSDEETLEKVNHVAAVLPSNVTISGNYSGAASLQAMDANGNVLPSVVTPFETTMKVTTKTTHSNSSSSKSSSTTNSSSK